LRARAAAGLLVAATLLVAPPAGAASRTRDVRARAFASCTQLVGYARRWRSRTRGRVWAPVRGTPDGPVSTGGPARTPATLPGGAGNADGGHSTTNNQEEGVDEPDVVKTDGRRIFATAGEFLHAVSTRSPRLLGSLRLPGGSSHELLLRGDTLLVLSRSYDVAILGPPGPGRGAPAAPALMPAPAAGGTRIYEVDVSDPAAMRIRRTMTVDGEYVSARLNGNTARVVISSSPYIASPGAERRLASWVPRARLVDRARHRTVRRFAVGCRAVRRPESFSGLGMLTVLTIDMRRGLPPVDSTALMTDAQTVYGSPKSLYVATQRWVDPGLAPQRLPAQATTALHRFDASTEGTTAYRASGEVPGYLLNQFSLSEHRGVLRVATTEQPVWIGDARARSSESFVTVLDQAGSRLVPVGRVGELGHGERIYSVRFLGDVGYVVTFRQVDPLYTIDLSLPAAPRIVGELKLAGYSAYLHPVGPGRLLGVGQDATEQGRTKGAQAVLFDVSDLSAPKVLGRLALGGTSSSGVEYDHRAFLHWPATRLAVLPVQAWSEDQRARFTGAVAVRVDPTALSEAGRIVHRHDPPSGPGAYDPGAPAVLRSLVAGEYLFTLSQSGLLASDLGSLADAAWVPFPGATAPGNGAAGSPGTR
jgi:hypothetical protein